MSIDRIWRVDDSVYKAAPNTPFSILNGGPSDYKRVSELFQQTAPPHYTLAKVEVIVNMALEESFKPILDGILNRKGAVAPVKKERPQLALRRDQMMQSLDKKSAIPLTKESHLWLVPFFHGTHPSLLPLICQTGFSLGKNSSPGVLGKAIYHTSSIAHAHRVHNCGFLLLNWVATCSPTFVSQEDLKDLKHDSDSDAHYSLVAPEDAKDESEVLFRPFLPGDTVVDELAVFEPSQILPRYLVTVTVAAPNLKELPLQPNKTNLIQMMGILFQRAQDEQLRNLILPEMTMEGKDPTISLTPSELWLHKRIVRLLRLDVQSVFYPIAQDQITHFLKIDARKKKLPPINTEMDQDYILGKQLINSNDVGNYEKAVEHFRTAAKRDCAAAWFELGNCNRNALGVKKNEENAFVFYKKAALLGHVEALFLTSQCYKEMNHYSDAIRYAKAAAKNDHPGAQDYLGHCYLHGYTVKKNPVKAVNLFKRAADLGNESARYYLALCIFEGNGTEKNKKQAFQMWKDLADEGNYLAQYQVCQCYKLAQGVEQNFPLAIRYALLAASAGHTEAQEYVGHCFYRGLTLPQDYDKAFPYFVLADARGNESAEEYLGICFTYGRGVAKDIDKGFQYSLAAADKGRKEAQLTVGRAYKEGFGVEKNRDLAEKYLKMASENGVEQATLLLTGLDAMDNQASNQ